MAETTEGSPLFSLDDLVELVELYGVDLFPPLDLGNETTRAQAFFAELRDHWPHLYANATIGTTEFKISSSFQFGGGKNLSLDTFGVGPRGPTFIFPRRLGVFQEDVDLRGVNGG
jgi:hypothetical protein